MLSVDGVQGLINLQTHLENMTKPRCPVHPYEAKNGDYLTFTVI